MFGFITAWEDGWIASAMRQMAMAGAPIRSEAGPGKSGHACHLPRRLWTVTRPFSLDE